MARRPRLRFDTTIYKRSAVRGALRAFRSCADLRIVPRRGVIEVEVLRCPAGQRGSLLGAFANYVLGATWKAR